MPQSLSTDPRMGRVSLKAALLFPLMWINCDDQGRISGDPDEIKYATCPNIDHITKIDIPELLEELERQGFLKVYSTSKTKAIQMLDWWEEQKLQWAYPSRYPAQNDWTDHLRYHSTPKEIITENWPPSGEQRTELLPSKPASALPSKLEPPSPETLAQEIRTELISLPDTIDRLAEHEAMKDKLAKLGERKGFVPKSEVNTELGRIDLLWEKPTGESVAAFEIDVYSPREKSLTKLRHLGCPYSFVILRSNPRPLQWEQDILLIGLEGKRESSKEKELKKEKEKEKEIEEEEGRLPSVLGSKSPSPSPVVLSREYKKLELDIYQKFIECMPFCFAREPDARELSQIRDYSKEFAAARASPQMVFDAFKEATSHNKMHLSYVRAVVLDWLGIERERSP